MPTRELLLAWGIRKTEKLNLAEGLTVTIRQLMASELMEAQRAAKALTVDPEAENLNLCAAIICRSAIEEDGSRVFQNEDLQTVAEFSYASLNELVEPVFRLNGLMKDQAEDTKKNSEQNPATSLATS